MWPALGRIAGVLLVLTLPFWFSDLDIAVQSLFYHRGWILEENPLILFLYRWGVLPGLLLACGGLLLLIRRSVIERRREWRRAAAALLITLFLGPGLLINGISKKYTGRPRPRETIQFGGDWRYHRVMDFGVPGRGHSFPAGHPSTGFLLFSLYYSFRRRNPRRARAWLGGGIVYGGIMGMGRIVQGAHFLSDVVWSGGMTLMAARIAHEITGGDCPERSWFIRRSRGRVVGGTARLIIGAGVFMMLILGMLAATPFSLRKNYSFPETRVLVVDLAMGQLTVSRNGGEPGVAIEARGFAPPFSRYRCDWAVMGQEAVLRTRKRGIFFELNARVTMILPRNFNGNLVLRTRQGDLTVRDIPGTGITLAQSGGGTISWRGTNAERRVLLRNADGDIRISGSVGFREICAFSFGGELLLPTEFRGKGGYIKGTSAGGDKYFGFWEQGRGILAAARSIGYAEPDDQ